MAIVLAIIGNLYLNHLLTQARQNINNKESNLQSLSERYNEVLNRSVDTQTELDEKTRQEAELKAQIEDLNKQLQSKAEAKKAAVIASARKSGSCEEWRPLIEQYSWNVNTAMEVCRVESGGNPTAANLNDHHKLIGCTGSFGLFQINCGMGQIFDPAQNVAAAFSMWQKSGWQPWSFTTCRLYVVCV